MSNLTETDNEEIKFNSYHLFSVIFASFFAIISVILGFVYPKYSTDLLNSATASFNISLTLVLLLSDTILTYFMFAVATIIEKLDKKNN